MNKDFLGTIRPFNIFPQYYTNQYCNVSATGSALTSSKSHGPGSHPPPAASSSSSPHHKLLTFLLSTWGERIPRCRPLPTAAAKWTQSCRIIGATLPLPLRSCRTRGGTLPPRAPRGRASNKPSREYFTINMKALTMAYSWFNASNSAFTLWTLLRHCAKQAPNH